jgi:hypothetical protein
LVNGTSSFYHHICRAHIPSSGLDHFEILWLEGLQLFYRHLTIKISIFFLAIS